MRRVYVLALVSFSTLLLLSVILYQERTVFIDMAFHTFYLLKSGSLFIQNYRIAAFFTQLFPLLASYMGWSLGLVCILYSSAFIVLYFASFLLIWRIGDRRLAIAYLIFNLLLTTHTFYWIQSELPQGAAFLFLFWAGAKKILDPPKPRWMWVIVALVLMVLVVFSHPLLMFAFFFIAAFYFLRWPENWKFWAGISLVFLFIAAIKSKYFATDYDSHSFELLKQSRHLIYSINELQSTKNFLHDLVHDYYIYLIVWLGVLVYYLFRSAYLQFLLVLGGSLGYIGLFLITYPQGADQFYLENQYQVLSIFVCLPLIYDVLPAMTPAHRAYPILALICIMGLFRIYAQRTDYQQRLEWERQLMEKTAEMPQPKLILTGAWPKDILKMAWASSYEFWLLSTLDHHASRSIIIEEQPGEYDYLMDRKKTLILKWESIPYDELSPPYFLFGDTSSYLKYEL